MIMKKNIQHVIIDETCRRLGLKCYHRGEANMIYTLEQIDQLTRKRPA